MGRVVQLEAIYRKGILRPLQPLNLPEDQRVTISVHLPTDDAAEKALADWQAVYAGLDPFEVSEVERAALDRSNFAPPRD